MKTTNSILLLFVDKTDTSSSFPSYMERIGATESREAMRMPLSQIQAVSSRDHVGSPLAFPCPKICMIDTVKAIIRFVIYCFCRLYFDFCLFQIKKTRLGCTRRAGTRPSLAMACRSRGAPVRLWRPAPQVEKKDPITITHGDGQAKVPITKFPWTPSPNLKKNNKHT